MKDVLNFSQNVLLPSVVRKFKKSVNNFFNKMIIEYIENHDTSVLITYFHINFLL